ncbi:MurR/RpiR family transcriptional regulator, partial [Rhodobacteraceae bacterium RKSG542]|uniref:MurR/RpiR family transcriptional regulator n=1 Tax=Pseudovibrio flavus TaxID=2529854 RepID=UPI0012BC55CC
MEILKVNERQSEQPRVQERLKAQFDALTRAERQLANSLLENYPMSGLGTIAEVATASGVSTPTVVRLARKLGFTGFSQMQAALRAELEETISNPITKRDKWAADAPPTHILNRFAASAMDNLQQTLGQVDPHGFDEALIILAATDRPLHIMGGRITRALADYFFTHMQVIRGNVTAIASNANTWPHYLLNMKAGDTLVIFDIRRYEHDILKFAELASEKDVEIILLTDEWGSPASRYAKHTFRAYIESQTAWDSSIALMFLVEALIEGTQS